MACERWAGNRASELLSADAAAVVVAVAVRLMADGARPAALEAREMAREGMHDLGEGSQVREDRSDWESLGFVVAFLYHSWRDATSPLNRCVATCSEGGCSGGGAF